MNEKLQHILKQGESEILEFKTSFSDEVIISLGAFANAKGGMVYVGVSDNGEIKGVDLGKETIAQWINEIKNKTAPVIIPDAEIIEENNKTIIALKIQEYPVKPENRSNRMRPGIKYFALIGIGTNKRNNSTFGKSIPKATKTP